METERPRAALRQVAVKSQTGQPMPEGFVECGSCASPTLPSDLYLTEHGQVCHVCQADSEADETLSRGAGDQVWSVLFSPGYVALGIAILIPFANFLFGPAAGKFLSPIALVCTLVGLSAMRTAATMRGATRRDRIRLGLAGLWSFLIVLGMGASMWLL